MAGGDSEVDTASSSGSGLELPGEAQGKHWQPDGWEEEEEEQLDGASAEPLAREDAYLVPRGQLVEGCLGFCWDPDSGADAYTAVVLAADVEPRRKMCAHAPCVLWMGECMHSVGFSTGRLTFCLWCRVSCQWTYTDPTTGFYLPDENWPR